MAAVATEKLYTPEDLLTMPEGDRYELVDGRLKERDMSFWSSYVSGNVHYVLNSFNREKKSGWVAPEGATYQCFAHAPATVRKADVSFIRLERMNLVQAMADGHCRIAPDLAVEVLSPKDNAYEVDEKVQDYLRAGTSLVWVVNPLQRTVEVHRRNGPGIILRETDRITGEEIIPGFECQVSEFFLPAPGLGQANGVAAAGR
jgi:Uma2 family endonuclease